ncbi:tyrosine--tRNA ligase [Micromonospora haikouensis]|uniref:Tyrosine--tRNA ligase n=1 Tax=Micromonospora haikouensis TaxID=686309 RepID=A0A0D0WU54_9ACTN|nr:tyrosine--tRNA ligase [Micromonospora haikouensis]KIR62154.1 tyrosyl-tRNA synthetase [Micromonospora haikouensis]
MTDSSLPPTGRDSLTEDLQWRGLIQDSTGLDELRALLDGGSATFYVGFDPTAASLHVGHLMQVTTARRLQLGGHRPLLLVGGATGQIGDPKESAERTLNPPEVVAGWVDRIRDQLSPFVSYAGENAARLVNNLDWTGEMSVVEFLRDVGKHFPVNKMLAREVVKARLETGISFTEFSYQLLQSHDFYELHRRHGCQLQFGGSDQWGNITAGVDYVRRRGAGPVQAFVTPLVTKADGTKFGKTEGGAVWLDPQLTSPYAFYQFWLNADDRDVVRYLRYFSFRSRDEIEQLEKETAERPAARLAQRALAEELTTLVHGERETAQAVAASQALFGRGSLDDLTPETLRAALTEAGLVHVDELPDVAGLLRESGLVPSAKEARRVIAEGGAYVNNTRITEVDAKPTQADLLHGRYLVLRRGKKSFAGVELRG